MAIRLVPENRCRTTAFVQNSLKTQNPLGLYARIGNLSIGFFCKLFFENTPQLSLVPMVDPQEVPFSTQKCGRVFCFPLQIFTRDRVEATTKSSRFETSNESVPPTTRIARHPLASKIVKGANACWPSTPLLARIYVRRRPSPPSPSLSRLTLYIPRQVHIPATHYCMASNGEQHNTE